MPTILTLAASVLAGYAVALVLPILAALMTGDGRGAEGLGVVALGYGFVSLATILALRARMRPLSRGRTYLLVLVCWAVMVAAPIPVLMLIEPLSFVAAFFEATSAAVALGTSFVPAESVSTAMMIFRAVTAWYAGLLALVMVVYVLAPHQVGGLANRHLRLVMHGTQGGNPRFGRTVAQIALPYAGLTALCAIGLIVAGVPLYPALTAGFAALATNGYLPGSESGSVFGNANAEFWLMVFMIIGGTSILWHRMIFTRRWDLAAEHRESYVFLGLVLVVGVATAVAGWLAGEGMLGEVLLNRLFDAASVVSTAGIVHTPAAGLGMPVILAIMLGMAGAAAYSPGGGLKLYRVGVLVGQTFSEARRLTFPRAVMASRYGSELVRFVWSVLFLYLVAMCLAALAFSGLGYPLEGALTLAVGALSSVHSLVVTGLAMGPAAPEAATTFVLALAALAGRVEILVVLAATARAEW